MLSALPEMPPAWHFEVAEGSLNTDRGLRCHDCGHDEGKYPGEPGGTPGSAAQARSPAGPPAPQPTQTGTAPAHAGATHPKPLERKKSMPSRAKLPTMNVALRKPWTQEQFFSWAEAQETRYEFDGFQPVAMTGGNLNHSRVTRNLGAALHSRLRGGPCEPLGPDAGVETVNKAVRYPDALVTCTKADGKDHLVPGVVVVFEVLSPTSGRIDRIVKVREYAAVPSIRRYAILETTTAGVTVFERPDANTAWTASTLIGDDLLRMPEINIEIPVAEFYEDLDLGNEAEQDATSFR
jgi:Uma2 family endonuclease